MTTAIECLTDTGPLYLVFTTCERSEDATFALWMSSPAAFLARTLVWRAGALVSERAREAAYGLSSPVLLASYDRESCSWRTLQLSLPGMEVSLLATLPRWGTLHHGVLSQQPNPVRLTFESAGGVSLFPTPQSCDYRSGDTPDSPRGRRKLEQGWSFNLNDVANWPTPTGNDMKTGTSRGKDRSIRTAVRTWATPAARDWRSGKAGPETMDRNSRPLNEQIETGTQAAGALNPAWVESLMGYPPDWTALDGGEAGPPG